MTQATAQIPASELPERGAARRLTDAIGRSLIGSDRPWDPANRFGLIILCLVMIGAFGIAFPNFFTIDNAFTILLNITAIGIATFGSSMLLISGNVDLSIAGMYGLIAVSTATVVRDTQDPIGHPVRARDGSGPRPRQRPADPSAQHQSAHRHPRNGARSTRVSVMS